MAQRSLGELLRSVGAFLLADGLGVVGAVVFSIVLARMRGAEELGLFSFSMAQGLLLQLVVEANFAITLPQEVARTGRIAAPLQQTQRAKWYLALVGVPLGLGLTLFLGREDAILSTVAAFTVTLLHSWVGSYTAALHGLGQMTALGSIIAVSTVLGALGGIGAIVMGLPLPGVILVHGFGIALPMWIWTGRLLRQREPDWSPWRMYLGEIVREVCSVGWRQTACAVLSTLRQRWYWIVLGILTIGYMRFGVLLLGWVGAAATVLGAYSAAQRFVVVLRMLPNAFFRVFLPQFTKRPESFRVQWALGLSMVVGLPLAALLHATAPWLIELTFRIPEAVPMLQLMGWALPGVMLSHVAESYALTFSRYQRVVVGWAAVVLGLGVLVALWGFQWWAGMAVAAVYVGMETLYALGIVVIVGADRRVHSHAQLVESTGQIREG